MAEIINDSIKKIKYGWFFEVFFAVIVGLLVSNNLLFAFLAIGGILGVAFSIHYPLRGMLILILIIPFLGHEWIAQPLFPIPGAKVVNLLGAYLFFLSVLNHKDSNQMPRNTAIFAMIFIGLFSIAIYRSLDYLNIINSISIEPLSPGRYWLSDWLRPIIYFLPFIIVLKYANSEENVRFVFFSIVLSVTLISLYLLYLYIFRVPDRQDVDVAAEFYTEMLGLHRNQIATFFIVGFPFVLSNFFIKKNIYAATSVLIVISATAFCFSRTAYATILGAFFLYLIISNRRKYLPVFIAVAVVVGSYISTTVIIERASKGLESGDASEISAGRIDEIWIPLIMEYLGNEKLILIGQGRYGILNTEAHRKGVAQDDIMHPHNMYIEQILDVGVFGICFIGWFLVGTMRAALQLRRQALTSSWGEFYCASLISVISFLIAGLTGQSLFPMAENSFFWVALGLLIVIQSRLKPKEGQYASQA